MLFMLLGNPFKRFIRKPSYAFQLAFNQKTGVNGDLQCPERVKLVKNRVLSGMDTLSTV